MLAMWCLVAVSYMVKQALLCIPLALVCVPFGCSSSRKWIGFGMCESLLYISTPKLKRALCVCSCESDVASCLFVGRYATCVLYCFYFFCRSMGSLKLC